jgi:hypothetical protein
MRAVSPHAASATAALANKREVYGFIGKARQ